MVIQNKSILLIFTRQACSLLLLIAVVASSSTYGVKPVRFATPLQFFTIYDKDVDADDAVLPRKKFLGKFRAGLTAEGKLREEWKAEREEKVAVLKQQYGRDWAIHAARMKRRSEEEEDKLLEEAFDRGVAKYEAERDAEKQAKALSCQKKNDLQFVGVINKATGKKAPITWYAQKKPKDSKWTVRLVHVNRDAIIKDLFQRGKVDVFGQYKNTGKIENGKALVEREYTVRERSWRTLWNFNPVNFFTDSSGNYWRERRVSPGLYTDGNAVYEASYRYADGRNGMSRVSTFDQFMQSKGVSKKLKQGIKRRLATGTPDLVLEED